MKTVKLTIKNCLDCPHHVKFQDPSSDDSFDFHDESVGCGMSKSRSRVTGWNTKGLRIISGPDKFTRQKDCKIPDWCPLAN